MVSVDAAPLTRISFRRDIKLFLAALVGFLIVIILTLLLLLQTVVGRLQDTSIERWNTIAEVVGQSLTLVDPSDTTTLESRLRFMRERYEIPAIELRAGSRKFESGFKPARDLTKISRDVGYGTASFFFDASILRSSRRFVFLTSVISLTAAILGTVLLFLYFPRIVRPIEEMLDHAKTLGQSSPGGDETRYLIETFKSSIDRLQTQESELKRLHSLEKTRADDLMPLADLGEISAGIAHEFRNSLSTILGYLKLARRSNAPEEIHSRIRNAEEEASLLSSAVEGLLSFARPMKIEMQRVDLLPLIQEIVDRIAGPDEEIEIEMRGEGVVIEGDRALLARAIENILRNAVDAIHQKGGPGKIRIALGDDPAPHLVIADSGIGLEASQAPRLFLPFQSDKPSGFGLGLALTKKIVLLHGGTIQLDGTSGEGATVTIQFPAREGGLLA